MNISIKVAKLQHKAALKIISPGIYSSFQDTGRNGYKRIGINNSGALDEYSYHWGNHILNNNYNSVSIEIAFGGFVALALKNVQIVITGAEASIEINNKKFSANEIINLKTKDKISIAYAKKGIRIYLAILNGFSSNHLFNSASVDSHNNISKAFKKNDILYSEDGNFITSKKYIAKEFIKKYDEKVIILRVLIDNNFFAKNDIDYFLNHTFTIGAKNNRVAYQLKECDITFKNEKNYSKANNYGSVQITPSGTPIIMSKDAPTIGGYPTIASVFSLDMSKLAQYGENAKVKFKEAAIKDMQLERLEFETFFKKYD